MIVKFIEASDGTAHGKFMLARMDAELATRSGLPGYEDEPLMTVGGRRKFNSHSTLVVDLQTGRGAALALDPFSYTKLDEGGRMWVCPMFRPFLKWLCLQGLGMGAGDITALPSYVEIR